MHLKVLILCCLLFCVIYSAPRKFEDVASPGYVMIGSSDSGYKNEEKNDRSAQHYTYPLSLHARPSSEYQGGYYPGGFQGAPYNPQPTSLISANVHLLEPFMLVTFLLFVLSLIDKARLPGFLRRNDQIKDGTRNYTNPSWQGVEPYYNNQQYMKTLADQQVEQNETTL